LAFLNRKILNFGVNFPYNLINVLLFQSLQKEVHFNQRTIIDEQGPNSCEKDLPFSN